jgi:hypothetical protein
LILAPKGGSAWMAMLIEVFEKSVPASGASKKTTAAPVAGGDPDGTGVVVTVVVVVDVVAGVGEAGTGAVVGLGVGVGVGVGCGLGEGEGEAKKDGEGESDGAIEPKRAPEPRGEGSGETVAVATVVGGSSQPPAASKAATPSTPNHLGCRIFDLRAVDIGLTPTCQLMMHRLVKGFPLTPTLSLYSRLSGRWYNVAVSAVTRLQREGVVERWLGMPACWYKSYGVFSANAAQPLLERLIRSPHWPFTTACFQSSCWLLDWWQVVPRI